MQGEGGGGRADVRASVVSFSVAQANRCHSPQLSAFVSGLLEPSRFSSLERTVQSRLLSELPNVVQCLSPTDAGSAVSEIVDLIMRRDEFSQLREAAGARTSGVLVLARMCFVGG